MKAIPTTYGGVRFRSRLEAKWAAYFDLIGLHWDYETIDLEGWAPDFALVVNGENVMVEVKPVTLKQDADTAAMLLPDSDEFDKARQHWQDHWVLCLGTRPQTHADYFGIGLLMDAPRKSDACWFEMKDAISARSCEVKWREACNRVQWRGQQ